MPHRRSEEKRQAYRERFRKQPEQVQQAWNAAAAVCRERGAEAKRNREKERELNLRADTILSRGRKVDADTKRLRTWQEKIAKTEEQQARCI